ncbi:sensor histidine kinase [Cryobacterium arcticum]|uniref:Signal transduction histidine kinase n=1 Tax=Cryobacterium arcticum TaxID=670052 RepID=A0A1B1BLN0_9MICO|nr:histidine kinase [Cryobacterium arcticum]ANP73567.1 Signal transduction histidine kinase [Cryobacterium arcticum]
MTPTAQAAPTADLRMMRRSTVLTLGLVVLVGGFVQLLLGVNLPPTPRMILLAVLTLAAVAAALAAIPLLLRVSGEAAPTHPLVLALIGASGAAWLLAVPAPFAGWGWAFLFALAGGVLSCLVNGWWKATVVLGTYAVIVGGGLIGLLTAPAVVASAGADDTADLIVLGTLALFTLMPLSAVWALQVVLRLEHARQTAAELAVAKERLRFATDLHDIQGHNLQVIALKSELAERLLTARPEQAAREIADIRVIAQAALDDTRAVVNDYRTVTVAVEVRNAAAVLRSAGIRCEARIETPGMPTGIGAVFAVAIREAATNVLRHSRATEATIELVLADAEEYRLTVSNNAAGAVRPGGTGLSGLAHRVAAQHGTVETTRTDDIFTLVVRVPATDAAAPDPAQAGASDDGTPADGRVPAAARTRREASR